MSQTKVDPRIVQALAENRKVRLQMPGQPGLREGRELVNRIQEVCCFPLVYIQVVGSDPEVLIWRYQGDKQAMEGHEVKHHEC